MIPAALTFPLPRWVTHKLENNYITRVLPTGVSSEPHFRLPAWGSDVRRSGPQRFGFKSQRECRLSTGRGEVRLSWRTYTRSCVSRTQGKSSDFIGTYIRPTCGSWRFSWGNRSQLWLTVWTQTLVAGILSYVQPHENPSAWQIGLFVPRPGPTEYPIGSRKGKPQANQPTEQEHGHRYKQTGSLKSSWTHSHL